MAMAPRGARSANRTDSRQFSRTKGVLRSDPDVPSPAIPLLGLEHRLEAPLVLVDVVQESGTIDERVRVALIAALKSLVLA